MGPGRSAEGTGGERSEVWGERALGQWRARLRGRGETWRGLGVRGEVDRAAVPGRAGGPRDPRGHPGGGGRRAEPGGDWLQNARGDVGQRFKGTSRGKKAAIGRRAAGRGAAAEKQERPHGVSAAPARVIAAVPPYLRLGFPRFQATAVPICSLENSRNKLDSFKLPAVVGSVMKSRPVLAQSRRGGESTLETLPTRQSECLGGSACVQGTVILLNSGQKAPEW